MIDLKYNLYSSVIQLKSPPQSQPPSNFGVSSSLPQTQQTSRYFGNNQLQQNRSGTHRFGNVGMNFGTNLNMNVHNTVQQQFGAVGPKLNTPFVGQPLQTAGKYC